MEKCLLLFCLLIVTSTLSAQVTLNPNTVFVNRENGITNAEILGISRTVGGSDLYGGMYAETNGSDEGRPFYGFAINSAVRAFTYFDGADEGIHTHLSGNRQSIWRDSMQWQTFDGSTLKYYGYKLAFGKDENTILGTQSVLYDSPSNLANTVIGSMSAQTLAGAQSNTIVGSKTSPDLLNGSFNTLLGSETGADLLFGSRNTMIGYKAGSNTGISSTGNVMLGYRAGENEQGSNKLYIANSETASPLIYGDFTNSTLEFNGNSEIDGNLTVNNTTTLNGSTKINHQLTSQDILIQDNNPYIQFYQNTTPKYYFQYQASADQFIIVEVGGGQVLKFKDGEVYLPQLAGQGLLPLRIDNDGRITNELPNPIQYNAIDFHAFGTTGLHLIPVKDLIDGMTITSLECVVACSGSPVGEINFVRLSNGTTGFGQAIFSLNPPGNGCGTFSTNTVVTSGSNVIDTDNYMYYFTTDDSDISEYRVIRLHH